MRGYPALLPPVTEYLMWSQVFRSTPRTYTDRSLIEMRGTSAFERFHPILGSAPLADRLRSEPMSKAEAEARAYAVWRTIDAETDTPERETRAKARRLAYVGRDLNVARGMKARLQSLVLVLRYLAAVITRSWGNVGLTEVGP